MRTSITRFKIHVCEGKLTKEVATYLSGVCELYIYMFSYVLSILKLQPERCSKLSVILRVEAKERQNTMEKADSIENVQRNEEKVSAIQGL